MVFVNTLAVRVAVAEVELGTCMLLVGSQAVEVHGSRVVVLAARAILVASTEVGL